MRLAGAWEIPSDEPDKDFLHFGRLTDHTMVLLMVEHKKNGDIDTLRLPFFITVTDQYHYMNFNTKDLTEGVHDGPDGFFFYKYRIEKNTLYLYEMAHDPIIDLISAGKLSGEISYKAVVADGVETRPVDRKNVECAQLYDSPEKITDAFETSDHAVLFPESERLVLKRTGQLSN